MLVACGQNFRFLLVDLIDDIVQWTGFIILKMKRMLTVLLLLGYTLTLTQKQSENLLRANRMLQDSFGSYTPQKSDKLKENCEDRGVNQADLSISDSKFADDMKSATSKYVGPRGAIETYLSTSGSTTPNIGDAAGKLITSIGAPFLFAILSLLSFWYLLFWCIFSCCCKKPCCMKEKKEDEPLSKCQLCIFGTGFLLSIALIIIVIIWAAMMGSTIKSIKYFPCAVTKLYSEFTNGVISNDGKFLGVRGVNFLVGNLSSSIDGYLNSTEPGEILAMNLNTDGATLVSSLETFKTTHTDNTKYRMTVGDSSSRPDSIQQLGSTLDSTLKVEVAALKEFGVKLHDSAQSMQDLSGSNSQASKDVFDNLNTQVQKVGDQIDEVFKLIDEQMKLGAIESGMNSILIVSIIVILIITIFFLVVTFMNLKKNKWHCLKCCNKFFMLVQILLGFILGTAAGFLAIFCVILSNSCYFMYQSTTDNTYVDRIQSEQIKKLFASCVVPNGTGDLSGFVSIDLTALNNMQKTLDGFNEVEKYSANLTLNAHPPVGKQLLDEYTKRRDVAIDDFLVYNTATSFTTYISTINTKLSNQGYTQRAALSGSCPSSLTINSTSGEGNTANNGINDPYCIRFGDSYLPTTAWSTARWGGPQDLDDVEVAKDAARQKITDYLDSTKGNYGGFLTAYTTYYDSEKLYYSASSNSLYDASEKMKVIKTRVQSLLDFLSSFKNDLFSALNCKLIGSNVKSFEIALCTKFTKSLIKQTDALTALVIILFFYSWCVCCGIRCAPKRDKNPNAVNPKSAPNSTPQNDPKSVNQKQMEQSAKYV